MKWFRDTFEISYSSKNVIRSMEGVRGFAVFLVFLVHYVTLVEPWLMRGTFTFQIGQYLRNIGNVGVDLFFVLSGYLIYGMQIKKHRPFKQYFAKRVRRIYPTFLVVFGIYILLSWLFPSQSKIPADWKKGLVYISQNILLLPGIFKIQPIITVAWSLSYEFFCYMVIPMIVMLFSMRLWKAQFRMFFFIFVTIFLFGFFALHNGPIRLIMFASGILLFETQHAGLIKKIPPVGLLALLLAPLIIIAFNMQAINGWWRILTLSVLFFVFCLDCFESTGITAKLFMLTPLRWLGNMSYSYYLIHGLALKTTFTIFEKFYPAAGNCSKLFWLLIPPIFALTLIPSIMLFTLVEKPYSLAAKPKTQKTPTTQKATQPA